MRRFGYQVWSARYTVKNKREGKGATQTMKVGIWSARYTVKRKREGKGATQNMKVGIWYRLVCSEGRGVGRGGYRLVCSEGRGYSHVGFIYCSFIQYYAALKNMFFNL